MREDWFEEYSHVCQPMRTPLRTFLDWFRWRRLKSHRYCRIDTDSMGCPREERSGRILRVWSAPVETRWDQTDLGPYAFIRYDDGGDDRELLRILFWNDEMQRYEHTR